ncbi:MAG: glycosyltransferase family 4 protein [Vicinamibacterales bacterium]
MRIAFCLNGPNEVNGPNVWLLRHLPLLRALGARPEVCYLSTEPDMPCAQRDALAAQGFEVRSAKLARFTEESVQSIVAALGDDPPDVFVPNYSVPAYFASRFLREAGVATVGVLHSDDPYYHDILDAFVAGDERWRLSGVAAVSDYLMGLVRDHATANGIPAVYAPCGTPVPDRVAMRRDDGLRLLYAGRLVEHQKRVTRVARRLCSAALELPEVDAVIYGRGEAQDAVEAALGAFNTHGRVRLGGALPHHEMQAAMLAGHVFVLLSEFEGLSVALLEAMAAGLVPIVSPLRSGALDVVTDGETGFIVEPDDEQAFVGVVRRLARERGLWERMSAAARNRVRHGGFTSNTCADRWFGFCRTLVGAGATLRQPVVPPIDEWALPPRCTRPGGIEPHDRRTVDLRMLEEAARGRPVYLWGAGSAGRTFMGSRPAWQARFAAAIDSNPARHGSNWEGLPVVSPMVLDSTRAARPFVVIASQFHVDIAQDLEGRGFVEGLDFVAA